MGFPCHFWLACLSLYSEHICSLNKLVLKDKEDAEYQSFECLIETHKVFQFSPVMLCTFHAIWQSFKCDLYPLLPSTKTRNCKLIELTKVGQNWGEYQLFINKHLTIILNDLIYIFTILLIRICQGVDGADKKTCYLSTKILQKNYKSMEEFNMKYTT